MTDVKTIIDLLEQRGDSQYGGEAVTQLEHALQAALLAEQEQAPPELIVAALLHDVGHLAARTARRRAGSRNRRSP